MQVVHDLHAKGHKVVIVSSGAVGVGAQRLGLTTRPKEIAQKQALAAVGQVHLMRYYEDFFHALGLVWGAPLCLRQPPALALHRVVPILLCAGALHADEGVILTRLAC
jgi:glutamate 5-kinase